MEVRLERGMRNFQRAEYGGVTETWNVIQHEVTEEYFCFLVTFKTIISLKVHKREKFFGSDFEFFTSL
jgi:hypothetical protein